MKRKCAMSCLSSSSELGGIGVPSGVRTFARRSGALHDAGLKSRMPRRARQLFSRLIMRVRSPTKCSCSRLGRLPSAGDSTHPAMVRLTTQPADKRAHQMLGIKTICRRPPMLARHANTRRVDYVGFDLALAQPARKPEAVAASFVGYADALDRMAGLFRLVAP